MGYVLAIWVIGCAIYWFAFRAPELARQPAPPSHTVSRETEWDRRQQQEWEWYERDPLTRGG